MLKSHDEIVRKFANEMGFMLQPSDDTMKAVRLARTKLNTILKARDAEVREMLKCVATTDPTRESDEYDLGRQDFKNDILIQLNNNE